MPPVNTSGERAPTPTAPERSGTGENGPEQPIPGAEAPPQAAEQVAKTAPATPTIPLPPPVPITPATPSTPVTGDNTNNISVPDSGPAHAAEVDIIERGWVDQSKELRRKYSDDPYNQERATRNLGSDYIKKRFNKEVKPSE